MHGHVHQQVAATLVDAEADAHADACPRRDQQQRAGFADVEGVAARLGEAEADQPEAGARGRRRR
jgi:hypothetical protein